MNTNKNIALLLLLLLIPNGFWHTMEHIPDAIKHFCLHYEEYGQVSVVDFIAEHAGDNNHHHDNNKHNNLPLNHNHATENTHTTIFVVNQENIHSNPPPFASVHNGGMQQVAYISDFCQSIWQPPQMS